MFLSSKLGVCKCHSNESSNYQEDYKDSKQDAVYSINPVTPDTSKYIVKLDVYSTKRQKACHCHLWNRSPVPWQRWNLSGVHGGAARSLEFSLSFLPSNPTQHQQRWCYKCPYKNYHHKYKINTILHNNNVCISFSTREQPDEKVT